VRVIGPSWRFDFDLATGGNDRATGKSRTEKAAFGLPFHARLRPD
jgi:hypothetical protein